MVLKLIEFTIGDNSLYNCYDNQSNTMMIYLDQSETHS